MTQKEFSSLGVDGALIELIFRMANRRVVVGAFFAEWQFRIWS